MEDGGGGGGGIQSNNNTYISRLSLSLSIHTTGELNNLVQVFCFYDECVPDISTSRGLSLYISCKD